VNDENYYAWLIESRSKSQSLLLDLYAFLMISTIGLTPQGLLNLTVLILISS
jgi:hypothetical protein